MRFAYTRRQRHAHLQQMALVTALAGLLLTAGCTTANWESPFGHKETQPAHPAVTSAPATQTQPIEAAATSPADPTQQLTQQVEQYVSNLPMDDLQAKLAHRDGQPAPAGALGSPQNGATADAAASTAQSAAGQQVPLQPEIVEPSPQSGGPKPAEPPNAVQPTAAPQDTRIVDIEISPAAAASAAPKAGPVGKQQLNQAASVKTNAGSSAGDLKDLLEQLRKEAAGRPDSVGAALRLRLAEWSLSGQAGTPQDWPLQDAEKRKVAESVWQVLQVVCRADGQSQRSSSEEFEKALESLSETLRQVQPLKVPKAALCWSVENFGHYEPLPEPWKFPGGQASMVVLYCELAGFRTEACTDKPGWHRTLLGERLAILTPEGKELWSYDEPGIEDLCHRPRQDFFVTKKLRIPGNLSAGPYVLKVTIRDLLANRVTETNVPFEIESVAATR